MTMVRGQFDRALFEANLNEVFGLGYRGVPAVYSQLFNVDTSDRAFEEDLGMIGLPAMARKDELGAFTEAEFKSGLKTRYEHIRYGLALRISYETIRDMKYSQVEKAVRQLGRSALISMETLGATLFNNAFTTVWHSTPNVPLISTAHPLTDGGTWANRLAVDSDLSVDSIQSMLTLCRLTPDDRGFYITKIPKILLLPPQLEWLALELLHSTDRPDTADRATNVIANKLTPLVWLMLDDADAWFVLTEKAEHEIKWWNRDTLKTGSEPIAQTAGDQFYYASFRSSCGASDPRGIYGTPGAA